jgi:hypothetical protein
VFSPVVAECLVGDPLLELSNVDADSLIGSGTNGPFSAAIADRSSKSSEEVPANTAGYFPSKGLPETVP